VVKIFAKRSDFDGLQCKNLTGWGVDREWILILHPVNPVHPVILAFHFAVQYVQIIHFREDFTSRVGGVRMAAPPLIEPDVRLFRIRLSCSLSPQAFTG
jgi:hypothetical protein